MKRKKVKRDANNPTRAEFIDLTLENAIDFAENDKKRGNSIDWDFHIAFLKKIRKEFVQWTFADDRGPEKGSSRMSKQNKHFVDFRNQHQDRNAFHEYEGWCDSQNPPIPKSERYADEDSFRDRIKREKRQKESGV